MQQRIAGRRAFDHQQRARRFTLGHQHIAQRGLHFHQMPVAGLFGGCRIDLHMQVAWQPQALRRRWRCGPERRWTGVAIGTRWLTMVVKHAHRRAIDQRGNVPLVHFVPEQRGRQPLRDQERGRDGQHHLALKAAQPCHAVQSRTAILHTSAASI